MARIAAQVRASYPARSTPPTRQTTQQHGRARAVADPGVRRRAQLGPGPLAERRVDGGGDRPEQRPARRRARPGRRRRRRRRSPRPRRPRPARCRASRRPTGAAPARPRSAPARPAGWRPARSRWRPSRAGRSASRWRSGRRGRPRPARRTARRAGVRRGRSSARRGPSVTGVSATVARPFRQNAMASAGAAANAISGADEETASTATDERDGGRRSGPLARMSAHSSPAVASCTVIQHSLRPSIERKVTPSLQSPQVLRPFYTPRCPGG